MKTYPNPILKTALLGASLYGVPFFLAGGLKLVYDLALYFSFRALKPPEEQDHPDPQQAAGTIR